MSTLFIILFFGGGSSMFVTCWISDINIFKILDQNFYIALKIILVTFLFVFVRANLPRFRFDQLMFIGWKIFLPVTLGFVFFFPGLLFGCNCLEITQLPRLSLGEDFINSFSTRF
jgi:NADH-quinone oxidoreductase subunit H